MANWSQYREKAEKANLLIVGAGGIGCELIKNLVLAGFVNLEVIDLDTIDVTNLNRQFLFQRRHVGKGKSEVAKESAVRFNPEAKIKAIRDSIMNSEYGVSYFQKFDMVLNALDNRAARSHVNRMCLAADIPLVESGTAGYLGQVTVICKKKTECYECTAKPHQKTFPGCTIRNTPSEPIHCIVWAKHLFNQLFGEADPDEDVSPDTEDPELQGDKKDAAPEASAVTNNGNVARVSTRQWAEECDYEAEKIFTKLFDTDIAYLLTMDKLWSKRKPPTPLKWSELGAAETPAAAAAAAGSSSSSNGGIKDQALWSIAQCRAVFEESIRNLKAEAQSTKDKNLVWDKDDEPAMDFVAACANIRCHIFSIQTKSRFDIKSMAGNIIPAIATTNAVIAGQIVLEAIKILMGDENMCKTCYLTRKPNPRKKILVPCQLNPPNPKCIVCPEKPEVNVTLNLQKMTVKSLEEKILKGELNMISPDVEIDGKGVILISSEEGDMEGGLGEKCLSEFDIKDGAILTCDDFNQKYCLKMILYHADELEDGVDYVIGSDISNLKAEEEDGKDEEAAAATGSSAAAKDEEDDIVEISPTNTAVAAAPKRRLDEASEPAGDAEVAAKKRKVAEEMAAADDVVCID